jgi:glycine/D-amino acid oxidase-like deaminating enzyme
MRSVAERDVAKTVAIIGGGLQGAFAAIACARRGRQVVIFERRAAILQGASRNNEGKIHLGFTYGLDTAGETQRLLARYGAAFRPALQQLLGNSDRSFVVARQVMYARHMDSLLSEEATDQHFEMVTRLLNGCEFQLPGNRRLPESETKERFCDLVGSARLVSEETIDAEKLCVAVAEVLLNTQGIQLQTGVEIRHATEGDRPSVFAADGQCVGTFDAVVNCAWDGLPELDSRSNLRSTGYCLRAKAGFIARATGRVPPQPVTFCFGPFGDIVPLGGDLVYLSWYPSCLMGFTTEITGGSGWFPELQSRFDFDRAYSASVTAFEKLCRGLHLSSEFEKVLAGAILASGSTDIDDRGSRLHKRTAIGIHRRDNYFSVNPGKLTLTPQLALELAASL